MSEQTSTTEQAISFHPTALDAAGKPIYRVGNQLRKFARVGDITVGELRWSKSKTGIWTLKLHRSGKTQFELELGRKRDQRDPRMMALLREQATAMAAEAKATEPAPAPAPEPTPEPAPEQPQLPAPAAA